MCGGCVGGGGGELNRCGGGGSGDMVDRDGGSGDESQTSEIKDCRTK